MFENIPIYFSERDRVCNYRDLIFIILSELEEYIAHSSYVVASEILLFDEELDTKIKEVLEKKMSFFYEKNLICYHPQSRERYLMKSDIESAATLDGRVNELLDKKYFINLRDKQFPMQITKKESKVEEIKFFFNPKIINDVKFRISKIIYYKVLRDIQKRKIKVLMPEEFYKKVEFLCKKISNVEWSGILLYTCEGTITKPESFIITLRDIILMDKGSNGATEYELNGGEDDFHIDYMEKYPDRSWNDTFYNI